MFAVVWTEHAMDDLADAWVSVDPATRDRIEAAVTRLNAELRDNPGAVGESRPHNRRIGFAGPLVVYFQIDLQTQVVRINHAWLTKYRPK